MSMFKSLQNAPRVVSVFTKTPAASHLLTSITAASHTVKPAFDLEIHTSFPTYDQLAYLYKCEPRAVLESVVPLVKNTPYTAVSQELVRTLAEKNLDSIGNSKIWNDTKELWVDWENLKLGDSMENFPAK